LAGAGPYSLHLKPERMHNIKFKDKKEGGIAGIVDFEAGTFMFNKNGQAYMGRGHRVTFPPSVKQLSGASKEEQRANFVEIYGDHFEIDA
jgi:hypothetical protein